MSSEVYKHQGNTNNYSEVHKNPVMLGHFSSDLFIIIYSVVVCSAFF